jgi:hypothetical protein
MSTFIYDMSDTWNSAGSTFNAIKMNVTDTASLADSKLLDLQISGISKFNVDKTGNVMAINLYANAGTIGANLLSGTLVTSNQPNITSVGTLTSLTVSGNTSFGNLSTTGNLSVTGNANVGNISANTGIFTTANATTINSGLMQNGNSNVTITSNGNVTISAVGAARIIATSTGANITGSLVATGNITGTQLISTIANGTAPFVVTSTTQVANLTASNAAFASNAENSLRAATVTSNAQPNITSVGNLISLNVVDDIVANRVTANSFIAGSGTGTPNISSQSNLIISAVTDINLISTNVNATGNLVVTGNVTGGNLGTAGTLNVTGNANVGNLTTGTGSGGTISGANLVSANFFSGTLTTAAQPNITSVGTLTGLTVGNATANTIFGNGTISATGNASVGNIDTNIGIFSLIIANNISAVQSIGAQLIGSGNSNITLTPNGNITLNAVGGTRITATSTGANITGTLGVSGNVTSGNIVTGAGSGGSIVGANLISSNFFVGTILTTTQPNITSVGTLTGLTVGNATANTIFGNGTISATGNANVGNLGTATAIITTGNITTINSGLMQNGNSNVTITSNGNVTISAVGGTRITATSTGANVTGTLGVSGNTTLSNLNLQNSYLENIYNIIDGASVDLDPVNGTIQTWTLGASRSPTATNFINGQSITLMIDDGSDFSITWPSVTWKTEGGLAPTLNTVGFTVIVLWKVDNVLYGARVGNA